MNKKWFEMTDAQLEQSLNTSVVNGLTKKQVSVLKRKKGLNTVFRLPHGSFGSYLKEVLSDSSSMILILAALIAAFFQNTTASYTIAGIIVINLFVVVFTYIKAHRILESMGEYSLPGAKVVRDGHLYLVSMSSLVPGDLICLKAGDIVPADARIVTAEGFFVSEKGITGNVSAIRKSSQNVSPDNDSNETMFNMAFATSVVLKGSARAIVVETGDDTLVSRTHKNELDLEHNNLDIFIMLKNFGSKISMLMLSMVFVIMFFEIITGLKTRSIYDIFLSGMSIAVAAMTEFYVAFGYIIVACGLFGARTYKQREKSAIMKNINAIEKLRDINCVIFRKDGFLSQKNKIVDSMYASGQIYRTKDYDKSDEGFAYLLEAAAVSTGVYMKGALSTPYAADRPLTQDEEAIVDCAKKYGLYNISLDEKYPLVMHRNSNDRRFSYSVVKDIDNPDNDGNIEVKIYMRGNARYVIGNCSTYSIGTTEIPIDQALKADLISVISEYERVNTTVYAVSMIKTTKSKIMSDDYTVASEKSMSLLGLISLKAPLLEGSAITAEKLKSSGIKLIMNATGASAEDIVYAKSLGICSVDGEILSDNTLASLTDEALKATITNYSVYLDLKNASLRKAIHALKENGYKVAYCADSLSDISVLEQADIGYTYADIPDNLQKIKSRAKILPTKGDDTSDALRFKSDVIIPQKNSANSRDGGIFSVEKSILTSKLIYRNLINMFAYLFGVQCARLFIILYSVFTKNIMLTPLQILVGGLFFDFLAILSISFSRPNSRTIDEYKTAMNDMQNMSKFITRNILFGVFWAVMTIFIPTVLSLVNLLVDSTELTTIAFISFTLLQIITLAEVKCNVSIFDRSRVSLNPFFIMSIICMVIFIGSSMLFAGLGAIMGVVVPSKSALIAIFLIVSLVVSLHEVYKSLANK